MQSALFPYLITLVSGAVLTFAFAPFSLWPITVLALAIAIRQLSKSDSPFKLGWVFGMGWFGAGISWVHVSIADFGGMPIVVSVALMALLCGYLAIYPALAFYALKRCFTPRVWPLALPLVWLVVEWLRSWMLTGFPWLSLGYSQIDGPMSGWFAIIGEVGVSALLVMMAAGLALWVRRTQWLATTLIVGVPLIAGSVLKSVSWYEQTGSSNIAMVQGNIAQSLRWVPEQDKPTMDKYLALTEPLWDNDLIIWPEAAIPKLESLSTPYIHHLDNLAASRNSAVITGIVNYNFERDEAYNQLIVVGKRAEDDKQGHYYYTHANRYAKHHLLPIGEFVPFEDWLRPLAPLFDLPMSSFSRGGYQQTNLRANGLTLAPAICFEIAFPRQVAANIHEDTNFIITVSNDAWFGKSHGPAQHLEIARTRAMEFARPVLRATNNGITAFIDANGELIARLPQFESASISAPVPRVTGITPYRQWSDAPIWLLSLISFIMAWRLGRNRRVK